jgi:hypothetical protein
MLNDVETKQLPAAAREKTAKLDNLVLLALPLKAANPDAKHPGKAGEKSLRGKHAFPLGFSRLSMGQTPHSFVSPKKQAKVVCSSNIIMSPDGVQGPKALGSGVRGLKKPPCSENYNL